MWCLVGALAGFVFLHLLCVVWLVRQFGVRPPERWVASDDCDCEHCRAARGGVRRPSIVVEKWKFHPPTVRVVWR